MTYFNNCTNLNDVKSLYKSLAMANHPDRGGNTEVMQAINAEYAFVIAKLAKGENLTSQQVDDEILNAENYKNAVNAVINLDGVTIELCGGWLWISGNTYQHRAIFSANGFYFASKKKMWYFRSVDYAVTSHKSNSMDYIRTKYGSQVINQGQGRKLTA